MIARRSLLLASAACVLARAAEAAPEQRVAEHKVTVTDATGHAQVNAPVRLARPFVRGEFPDWVAVLVDGRPGAGQCDVKQRWPDGSVKHAVISAAVPKLGSHGTAALTFAPATREPATVPDAQALLEQFPTFDAVLEIVEDGQRHSASARAMIASHAFTVWAHGPVATTLLCADHSVARKFDIGRGPDRALRPMFHVTFWHAARRAQVRVIAEVANTAALRDMRYDATVTVAGRRVLQETAVPHARMTRWTRTWWADTTPAPAYDTDHAIAYVIRAKALATYDLSLRVPQRAIEDDWAAWQNAPKGLYGNGMWLTDMGSTGGRDDLGATTGRIARWLLTGDWRSEAVVRGQAELAGAWTLYMREGDAAKPFDMTGATLALGRPISVHARPTFWLDPRDQSEARDRPTWVGDPVYVDRKWVADAAHLPDPFSVPYLLLGDPDLLAQAQMWAAVSAITSNPGYRSEPGQGHAYRPSGGIFGQIRGQAWTFRTRMLAAAVSPDGPEASYFRQMIDDAIAFWEGRIGITGTRFHSHWLWAYGQKHGLGNVVLPLFDEFSDDLRGNMGLQIDKVKAASCFWQSWMVLFILGWAKELGFPTEALLAHVAHMLTGQFAHPDRYAPENVGRYYTATRDATGAPLASWEATLPYYNDVKPRDPDHDVGDGYFTYACAAATMITDQPGGAAAYAWLRAHAYEPNRAQYAHDPKWAFLPRA